MNNKHERAIMRMDCWDHTPCPPPSDQQLQHRKLTLKLNKNNLTEANIFMGKIIFYMNVYLGLGLTHSSKKKYYTFVFSGIS